MARMNGRSPAPAEPPNVETSRLARSLRRDALIDAAADLVAGADVELSAAVSAAETLEDTFRALIRGALQAQATRGATFAALRDAGLRKPELRAEQRERDRMTLRYFASRAVREYGLERRQAKAAVAILLGAIDTVLAQWRQHPTRDYAALLEDTYVSLTMGGLARLASVSADGTALGAR